MFFETLFDLRGLSGEQMVCCPFPHTKEDGTTYHDHTPSMAVNLDKRVYNCKSCGRGGNENQMVAELFHTTSVKAKNFLTMLNKGYDTQLIYQQWEETPLTPEAEAYAKTFGITKEVLTDLMVTIEKNGDKWDWEIPVMWFDQCIDIRHYRPGRETKMYGEPGAPTGAIIPHDKFVNVPKNKCVILCAGEKDMLVTRSHGFNAITFTGGEMLRTPLDVTEFRGRKIAICYDNDQPGRVGAKNMAQILMTAGAAEVRIVTKFHGDFPAYDTKEDLTDWFTKYGGTAERLKEYINETEPYVYIPEEEDNEVPFVRLNEVLPVNCCGKKYHANVQILSVADEALDVPRVGRIKKTQAIKGMLELGAEIRYDILEDERHMAHIFEFIGKNAHATSTAFKSCAGISDKGVSCFIEERMNVFACTVADVSATYDNMVEFPVYVIGFKPVQGKKYDMEFWRMTDTTRGTAVLLSQAVYEESDTLNSWELTPEAEAALTYAQHVQGSVADKISHRARAVRGLLGYEADETMITAIDLTFNSVKEFSYGTATNIKGYLDTIIVGESRVGKSDTAKHLRDAYNMGGFISLAGSAATIPGIVGGSAKDAQGRLSTRAGIIPRNNEGIVIFEELAKAPTDVIKSLTDVRSSGLARITRVSGSVEMPAGLRMLTLSNARPTNLGTTRPLATYSGGLEVITELVGTAEDIARYDLCMLVGDPKNVNPLYNAEEPYPTEVLETLLRWTWSRKSDDIQFTDGSDQLIYTLSQELNTTYPLHIKLFGSECWKKLAKLAIAAACYTVSTDENFEKVLVTPEHVQWAHDFMLRVYDSELFKISDTVRVYLHSTQPNEQDTALLTKFYTVYSVALDLLYEQGKIDKYLFKELTNTDEATSNNITRTLMVKHFVESDRSDILATPKYKATYPKIDKAVKGVPKL